MGAKEINTLNNYILREIGTLSRVIHTKCDAKYKQYRLQKGQFIFLTRVCEHPGINSIELSNFLKVDKTTVSKAIHKLYRDGYVLKEQDSADFRAFKLYPTPQALEVYERILDEENANIELCFQGFSPIEAAEVNRLIKKMGDNIEAAWQGLKTNQRRAGHDSQS